MKFIAVQETRTSQVQKCSVQAAPLALHSTPTTHGLSIGTQGECKRRLNFHSYSLLLYEINRNEDRKGKAYRNSAGALHMILASHILVKWSGVDCYDTDQEVSSEAISSHGQSRIKIIY